MDRLFLDANILFSAAYQANAGLTRFWKLAQVTLCSSAHAVQEARVNLATEAQRRRLDRLARSLRLFEAAGEESPQGVELPEKDRPILLAAIAASATHLITGDFRHFGRYFGKRVAGILVLTPADYLRQRLRS